MATRKLKVESFGIADSIGRQQIVIHFSRSVSQLELLGIIAAIQDAIK